MMNHLFWVSFLFISLLGFALPPAGDEGYKTFFSWTENRKLIWADFAGEPVANASEVAMTASSVEFTYSTKGKQISYTVTAKYFPKLSWSKTNKQNEYVLNHEQMHFNITELYARMFRKRLQNEVKSTDDIEIMKSITKDIMKQWTEEQKKYDSETRHSLDEQKQKAWDLSIQQRMDALKEFASK